MVAYNFQSRFAEPILAGTKGGTIRATRRLSPARIGARGLDVVAEERPGGHARPGEMLQLYTGQRTKQCRRIADRKCIAAEPIELLLFEQKILVGQQSIEKRTGLNLLAVFDGFADFDEMIEFWSPAKHFAGWHVRWLPLPKLCD